MRKGWLPMATTRGDRLFMGKTLWWRDGLAERWRRNMVRNWRLPGDRGLGRPHGQQGPQLPDDREKREGQNASSERHGACDDEDAPAFGLNHVKTEPDTDGAHQREQCA